MGIGWSDEVDEVIAGDLAAGFAYLTPAEGVVITPMAPLGIRDREAGTVTVTTSLGLWKKLDRIRANPSVAVAFHSRDHADSDRPEFVLVQGPRVVLDDTRSRLAGVDQPQWEHFLGPIKGGLAGRWLEVYYWQRVAITIDVEPDLVWPDAGCAGEPVVLGEPLPGPPPPQSRAEERHRARTDATGSPRKSAPSPRPARLGRRGRPADGVRRSRRAAATCRRRRARASPPRSGPRAGAAPA